MLGRAYSVLTVKSIDVEKRVFAGTATTPSPDRVGDIVEPRGAKFSNPSPLLLFHDHQQPVGTVTFKKPTTDGIDFEAQIPVIEEPGTLRERTNEAWQSIRAGIVRGVSIGFRPLSDGVELMKNGGLRFKAIEILELSLVSVPANQDATIATIKSCDEGRAASGIDPFADLRQSSAGVSALRVVKTTPQGRVMKKSIADQIKEWEASRAATVAERDAIMDAASEKGLALDEEETDAYDSLDAKVKSIDGQLKRLHARHEEEQKASKPVAGANPVEAAASRGGALPVITVSETTEKGIGFARAVMCKMASYMEFQKGNFKSAAEFARERYPSDQRVHKFLTMQKTAVPAGTTTDTTWAAPLLADQTTLASEFLEYLRPETIIGKFGTTVNGVPIPPLRRVPFNVRIQAQSVGGSASWVGQGKGKPVTKFGYTEQTLLFTKIAAICVITEELARFSSPSAEALVRDQLRDVVVERMDADFIDPSISAVSGVRPASITNGVTPMTSAGTSAANVLTDMQNLLEPFILNKFKTSRLVIIMPETLAMVLSLQLNSLGQRAFPDIETGGGKLAGIPVITTQYAANEAQYGNMVIALNTADIALADDGQVTVDASREASIEMSDAPTNESATPTASAYSVSMFQTNSIALRAERYINWAKLRSTAVVLYDDVNWGSIGSPV